MQNILSTVSEYTDLSSSSNAPRACPVCAFGGPFASRPSPEGFHLFECSGCGVVFLFPLPSESQLASFYDEAYYGEERRKFLSPVEIGIAALSSLKWSRLQSLLSRGDRMLDIGCGRGALLRFARNAGFEAYGIERPSPVGHAVPGVLYKSLPECNFPDNHFQLVVLWHVLEHLSNPVATLQEIHRILKPGGWLSLAVPNYGGAQARASGRHWFHLDLPRHFWHFRRSSLEALLARNGFRVSNCATMSLEYDWYGTLQSWMNRAFHDRNRLYAVLKGSETNPVSKNLFRLTAASVLAVPALASALWDAARGDGGTLTVTAQKLAPEQVS